jgi:alpha-amylase
MFVPESKVEIEIAGLNKILAEKEAKLKKYETELKSLQTKQKVQRKSGTTKVAKPKIISK